MISSYGDQSTTRGIILHIIDLLNAASIALNASRDTLYFYTCNYNIRMLHREMVLLSIFFTNQIHGGIINQIVLYSFLSLHALALHAC